MSTRHSNGHRWRRTVGAAAAILLVAGASACSGNDSTEALEQELAEVTAERDALALQAEERTDKELAEIVEMTAERDALALQAEACRSDDDASEVPPGVTSTLEAVTEATNTYDSEALGALFTEDFTWQSTGEVQSRTEYLAHFDTYYEKLEFHAEPTGPLTIERDGDAYVAKQADRITSTGPGMTGQEVIRLVKVDGSWLIQEFRWTQDAAN